MNWFMSALPVAMLCAVAAGGIYVLLHVLFINDTPTIKIIALVSAFAGYMYFVVYLTLLSRLHFYAYSPIELSPIASYIRAANAPPHLARIEIRNAIYNIVMLIPLGLMLPAMHRYFKRLLITTAAGLATSVAIETAQLATSRGVFAIEDILHNTIGTAIGYIIYKFLSKFIKKP